jgi:hypothetical protein
MNESVKNWLWWAIPVVVVAGGGAALYFGRKHEEPVAQQAEPAQAPPAESVEPGIKHPIAANAEPLPSLNESDPALKDSLGGLFGRSLDAILVPKNIVRHVVVTIDNLPRKKTAVQLWPVKPTSGELVTSGADLNLSLSRDNDARYAAPMQLVKAVDAPQLVALYKRFYPLFQQAYVDLGYPDGYFNDRLVEVIDHLLETPDINGPIRLTQPGVAYQFADAQLEERSAGQKTLLRMGSENAAAIKAKLRDVRREIAKDPPPK